VNTQCYTMYGRICPSASAGTTGSVRQDQNGRTGMAASAGTAGSVRQHLHGHGRIRTAASGLHGKIGTDTSAWQHRYGSICLVGLVRQDLHTAGSARHHRYSRIGMAAYAPQHLPVSICSTAGSVQHHVHGSMCRHGRVCTAGSVPQDV